jgi:hypothetical protein
LGATYPIASMPQRSAAPHSSITQVTPATAIVAQPARAASPQPWLGVREIVSAEALLVLVTVFLALYTRQLVSATRELVKDAKASSANQTAVMERQRDVMAAQQLAMEQQAATAQESSRVLMNQALAMDTIATAVTASARTSLESVDLVKEAVVMARRHLVANFPPVIQVHRVRMGGWRGGFAIQFTLVNAGGSRATLLGAQAIDDWAGTDRPLPPHSDYIAVRDVVEGLELAPGAGLACTHLCIADFATIATVTRGVSDDGSKNLHFLVRCRWKDDNDVERESAVHLKYDRQAQIFAPETPAS